MRLNCPLNPQYALKFFAGTNDELMINESRRLPNLSSTNVNNGAVTVTEPAFIFSPI
jgi:hypothetical protein